MLEANRRLDDGNQQSPVKGKRHLTPKIREERERARAILKRNAEAGARFAA
jgi:hypothetical protein